MKTHDYESGRRARILRTVIFAVLLCVFLLSLYKVGKYYLDRYSANKAYTELRQNLDSVQLPPADTFPAASSQPQALPEEQPEEEPQRIVSMDFTGLQQINPEVIAWIYSDGTPIDYPVLHTLDNEFYLSHLYDGKTNSRGSVFMDCGNSCIDTDTNPVLYGHRMRDGSMFASLGQYKSQDYYEKHPVMMLYTPEGDYTVELFCGTVMDANETFVQFNFADDEEFLDYVAKFTARSTFRSEVKPEPGDRIITLCTCTYETVNSRYVVMGRLVPLYQ